MRLGRLAIAMPLLVGSLGAGCTARGAQPYRFASPLLGSADVPPAPLRDPVPPGPARDRSRATVTSSTIAYSHPGQLTRTTTTVDEHGVVRTVSAPLVNVASAAAAAAITTAPAAAAEHRDALSSPNQLPKGSRLPAVRSPTELRALVGYRDPRSPLAATLALAATLRPLDESGLPALHVDSGVELVAWADSHDRLHDALTVAVPGDLLVFDYTDSADVADRVAIVIARDAQGVTEYLYLGGGVWHRGFVDPRQPHQRRSPSGTVLNTFMRTGSRYPPKGTRYLAGELLAHVIAIR